MKRYNFLMAILVLMLVFGMAFMSCKDDTEPTYTV